MENKSLYKIYRQTLGGRVIYDITYDGSSVDDIRKKLAEKYECDESAFLVSVIDLCE